MPNVFRALARRPAELRAFLDYHDALMEREGGLSKAERELVVVATSGANHCVYCVVAHGAILRIRAKDPEIADRVATNPWTAPLPPRERAIVDLALVLATEPARLSAEHLDAARAAGLDDDEIWDVGAITALFALSNRMAHLTALRAEPGVLPDGPHAADLASRRDLVHSVQVRPPATMIRPWHVSSVDARRSSPTGSGWPTASR